jgi:hypothetical protein
MMSPKKLDFLNRTNILHAESIKFCLVAWDRLGLTGTFLVGPIWFLEIQKRHWYDDTVD